MGPKALLFRCVWRLSEILGIECSPSIWPGTQGTVGSVRCDDYIGCNALCGQQQPVWSRLVLRHLGGLLWLLLRTSFSLEKGNKSSFFSFLCAGCCPASMGGDLWHFFLRVLWTRTSGPGKAPFVQGRPSKTFLLWKELHNPESVWTQTTFTWHYEQLSS